MILGPDVEAKVGEGPRDKPTNQRALIIGWTAQGSRAEPAARAACSDPQRTPQLAKGTHACLCCSALNVNKPNI